MKYAIHLLVILSLAAGSWSRTGYQAVASPSTNANAAQVSTGRVPVACAVSNPARSSQSQKRPTAAVRTMQAVPANTTITVTMLSGVSTDKSEEGDAFTANLAQPIVVNNRVVAEKGARVRGLVHNIEQPGRVKGRAELQLRLTQITTGGRTYRLDTEPFTAIAQDNKDRDAGIIAGSAGAGAIIGAITGGKKGAAIGAVIGGGSGTTAVLVTRGQDLRLPPETRVNFVLRDNVSLPVLRRVAS